jgi:nucleotide-binding universal stress UspA family protein
MDGSSHGEAAAALGIDWALRFGSDLVGLGILDEPSITGPEPVPLGGMAYKRERDDIRLADAHCRILEVLARFDARCHEAGVRCAVVEEIGTPHEQIALEAEACDAVVLGRQTYFHFETQDRPDETLGHVLRLSPRPVVIVPRDPVPGAGVLVAYSGGREIARTLQTFTLLGLAGDETLDLLAVHADGAEAERRLRRPAEYLAAHGVRAVLDAVASDAAPAEVILETARRRRPRLLVMGAHGHHPVRDLFITSATRAVMEETPVPVFTGA